MIYAFEIELVPACGKKNFDEVDMNIFMRGDEFIRLSDLYFPDNLPVPPNAIG